MENNRGDFGFNSSESDSSEDFEDSKKEKKKKRKKKLAKTPIPVEKKLIKEKKKKQEQGDSNGKQKLKDSLKNEKKIKKLEPKEDSSQGIEQRNQIDHDDSQRKIEEEGIESKKKTDKKNIRRQEDKPRDNQKNIENSQEDEVEAEENASQNTDGYLGELIIDHSDDEIDKKQASSNTEQSKKDEQDKIAQASPETNEEHRISNEGIAVNPIDALLHSIRTGGIGRKAKADAVVETKAQSPMDSNIHYDSSGSHVTDYEGLGHATSAVTNPEIAPAVGFQESIDQYVSEGIGNDRLVQESSVKNNNYRENVEISSTDLSSNKRLEKTRASNGFFGWFFPNRSFGYTDRKNLKRILNRQDSLTHEISRKSYENSNLNRRYANLERAKFESDRGSSRKDRIIDELRSSIGFNKSNSFDVNKDKVKKSTEVEAKKPGTLEKSKNKINYKDNFQDSLRKSSKESADKSNDNRVELSSWHRIEKDKKTGKVVEKPTLDYGKEYLRELKQETLKTQSAKTHSALHLGSVAYAGSGKMQSSKPVKVSQNDSSGSSKVKLPSDMIDYINKEIAKNTTNPMIWLVALLIVFVLYYLGALS